MAHVGGVSTAGGEVMTVGECEGTSTDRAICEGGADLKGGASI